MLGAIADGTIQTQFANKLEGLSPVRLANVLRQTEERDDHVATHLAQTDILQSFPARPW